MDLIKLFIGLGGLVLLTILLAGFAKRYQQNMTVKRQRIKRILEAIDWLESLISRLDGSALPKDTEALLYEDIIERFKRIQTIDSRFNGITALIKEAERSLNQIPNKRSLQIDNINKLQRLVQVLSELLGFLRENRLLITLDHAQTQKHINAVATHRSECVYIYHINLAKQFYEDKRLLDALSHCNSIKSYLLGHGPANEQVKQWHQEAEAMSRQISGEINAAKNTQAV